MSLTRRSLLKTGAVLSAAATLPATARAVTGKAPDLLVYDSRLPESLVAMQGKTASMTLDLAQMEATNWSPLRTLPATIRSAQGLTGWTDWVLLRGTLEDRGLRFQSETSVPAPVSGKAHLFRWKMG
jgi:hypothetical protein